MINWLTKLFSRFFKKNESKLKQQSNLLIPIPKQENNMTSIRPYLIRAFYEWISDNHCTPHLIVDAQLKGVVVPQEYVSNGQIVLDIAEDAVDNLEITASSISFEASFGEEVVAIFLPIRSILAIYSLENDEGMSFVDHNDDSSLWDKQDQSTLIHSLDKASSKKIKSQKKSLITDSEAKPSHLTIIK
jgi:stringent starvation protein B